MADSEKAIRRGGGTSGARDVRPTMDGNAARGGQGCDTVPRRHKSSDEESSRNGVSLKATEKVHFLHVRETERPRIDQSITCPYKAFL